MICTFNFIYEGVSLFNSPRPADTLETIITSTCQPCSVYGDESTHNRHTHTHLIPDNEIKICFLNTKKQGEPTAKLVTDEPVEFENNWLKFIPGILTKMSQNDHYETICTDGNVHWECGSQVHTCELPSLTRFRTRGRSSR